MTPLSRAKERLTIPHLWAMRGWRGKPGRSCRVPWREDRAPSGSVLADGRLFHDFSSGENLDAPALLARVEELAPDAACRLFIDLAGVRGEGRASLPLPPSRTVAPRADETSERHRPEFPPLDAPTAAEFRQLAQLRTVSEEACVEAHRRGHLFCADWRGARCWLLTDCARRTAQLRRLDGSPFPSREGGVVKAWTLRGSCASWPIGTPDAASAARVLVCEGGGDFLAAYHFAAVEGTLAQVQPVAMLGAAPRIAADALPCFVGKPVRIVPDLDDAGAGAALRWERQLRDAGLTAHCYDLSGLTRDDGAPVKDLNDLTRISADDFEVNRELWALSTF
jgi:hypothetical protein